VSVEMFMRPIRPLLPLVPLGIIAVAIGTAALGLWRWRRSHSYRAFASALLDVSLTASIGSVLVLTLPPSIPAPRTVNLVPFDELVGVPPVVWGTTLTQMVANVLLFAPLGLLIPLKWRSVDSSWRVIAIAAVSSTVIEAAQFVIGGGRQTTITDVILNTAGAVLGFVILRTARWLRRSLAKTTVRDGDPVRLSAPG
jgi:glycopeptide antibiotics resistance protein